MMKNFTVKSFLILKSEKLQQDDLDQMKNIIIDFNENVMFFLAAIVNGKVDKWMIVIHIKHQPQVVINELVAIGRQLRS